jgi:hypothetical protein
MPLPFTIFEYTNPTRWFAIREFISRRALNSIAFQVNPFIYEGLEKVRLNLLRDLSPLEGEGTSH